MGDAQLQRLQKQKKKKINGHIMIPPSLVKCNASYNIATTNDMQEGMKIDDKEKQ